MTIRTTSRTFATTALLAVAGMSSTTEAWLLPVSSPVMSLSVIESTPPATLPQHPPSKNTVLPSISAAAISLPSFTQEQELVAPSTSTSTTGTRKVFCDLDGVLVDFEHGIRQLLPSSSSLSSSSPSEALPQLADLEKSTMWKSVRQADAFFEHLPWTQEGKALWKAIQHLQPDILTGVPVHPSSRQEKFRWCVRELVSGAEENGLLQLEHVDMACPWTHGHRPLNNQHKWNQKPEMKAATIKEGQHICRVITCWSSNKHYESGPGHILIDDRLSLKEAWERKGGIFIHHQTGNLENTLRQLEEHGLLLTAVSPATKSTAQKSASRPQRLQQ